MGLKTYYSKIWHLGISNILNKRNLRNGRCRKDFLSDLSLTSLEAGHELSGDKSFSPRMEGWERNPNE